MEEVPQMGFARFPTFSLYYMLWWQNSGPSYHVKDAASLENFFILLWFYEEQLSGIGCSQEGGTLRKQVMTLAFWLLSWWILLMYYTWTGKQYYLHTDMQAPWPPITKLRVWQKADDYSPQILIFLIKLIQSSFGSHSQLKRRDI